MLLKLLKKIKLQFMDINHTGKVYVDLVVFTRIADTS